MKIIISRTDAIGDVILTLPLVGLIKQKIPQAKVIFLAKNYTIPIVKCCKHVDEIIDYSKLDNMSETIAAKILAEYNANVIFHVLPNKNIAKIAKLAKIPQRIGTKNRFYHWTTCNKLLNISRKNSQLHETQLNLRFMEYFGFDTQLDLLTISNLLDFTPTEQNPIKLESNKKNIILHPKSAGSAREWGIFNFNKLVSILPIEQFNFYVTGTNSEKTTIDAEFDFSKPNIFNLIGKLDLSQLIAFISNCDALIAASTGPLHIAAATGINAIGLFPPVPPMHAGRWAQIGINTKHFTTNIKCTKCRNNTICKCLQDISPAEVAKYIMNTL